MLLLLLLNSWSPIVYGIEGSLGEVFHSCYVKNKSYTEGSAFITEVVTTTAECALHCSQKAACATFHVKPAAGGQTVCHLKKGTTVKSGGSLSPLRLAGWCPKGRASYPGLGPPGSSTLRCSNSSGRLCQFPVVVGGRSAWACLEGREGPVCSVEASDTITTFTSTESFQPCGECGWRGGSACIQQGLQLGGFTLRNHRDAGDYWGLTVKEECQQLCQLAQGCNFFNFVIYPTRTKCSLKYGVGKAVSADGNHYFGPRVCPGQQTEPQPNVTVRIGPGLPAEEVTSKNYNIFGE